MNVTSQRCSLMAKINQLQTYSVPDDIESKKKQSHKSINITPTSWPASTHVHGAEVRPTFDGNPLSWFNNAGERGVGAFSLQDQCYYQKFDGSQPPNKKSYLPPPFIIKNNNYNLANISKVNRYPNQQNSGNLWYHDHSMRLTNYNVGNGLSGLYILRDPKVEAQIGILKQNQKLIMMTLDGWKITPLKITENTVYRLRFLNNNFAGRKVFNISFSYNNCTQKTYDQRITFSLIGADSSLFHQSIDGQKYFFISQAQRVEILIKFEAKDSFSICDGLFIPNKSQQISQKSLHNHQLNQDFNIYNIPISKQERSQKDNNNRTDINNVSLSVPFVNLSMKADSQIAVKRMRPLIFVNTTLTINGRLDFHEGKSQNPIIGTTQDWYIINTISFQHPIHVHLINFQVVKQYALRFLKTKSTNCTLYQLQFLVEALKNSTNPTFQQFKNAVIRNDTINYTLLCDNKISNLYSNPDFKYPLLSVNIEDSIDKNRVSGIDLRMTASHNDQINFRDLNLVPNVPIKQGMLKFVTNQGTPPSKIHYTRWKDTAFLQTYQALVFRIRWTKSAYDEKNPNSNYFHVPADQLREHPGFVYHCHILPHQDNQMMRPIMLQLPDNYKLNTSITCNSANDTILSQSPVPWSKKYLCLNKNCVKP